MKTLCFFTSILFFLNTYSQKFEWVKTAGDLRPDKIEAIALDQDKNIYAAGSYENTVDFDPGTGTTNLTSNGSSDIFFSKSDSSGNLIWVKGIGGIGYDYVYDITLDLNGNLYITGQYRNTVDFDPSSSTANRNTSQSQANAYIAKYDTSGSFIWVKSFEGTSSSFATRCKGTSIEADSFGNVYSNGYFEGTVDFNSGSGQYNLSASTTGIYILKLNSSGNFRWAKKIISNTNNFVQNTSISLDKVNNIYLTSIFTGTVDFDPSSKVHNLTSRSFFDGFILRLNSSGKFMWVNQIKSTNSIICQDIITDDSSNVYAVGYFEDTIAFDTNFINNKLYAKGRNRANGYVAKVDSSGNVEWAKKFGGSVGEHLLAVALDLNRNIYVTGSQLYQGFLIRKLNPDGNTLWEHILDSSRSLGYSIQVDSAMNAYVSGSFDTRTDFNPGKGTAIKNVNNTSSLYTDMFTLKFSYLKDFNSYFKDTVEVCDQYIWNNVAYNKSGIYTDTIQNSIGCDSILTLNLSIDSLDTGVTVLRDSLFSNQINALSYQWLDCSNNFSQITGATGRIYKAIINGSYAVEISSTNCIDTSSCVNVISVELYESAVKKESMAIFPNPTNGVFSLKIVDHYSINNQLKIYDTKGRIIYKVLMNNNSQEIDLSNFEDGLYFVQYENQFRKLVLSK